MKTGTAGLEIIKSEEGLGLEAYQDIVGVWTIGYGDTLDVEPGMTITAEEAEEDLVNRLADEFEPVVNQVCSAVPTTQAQFDAMISLSWNIGVGAFARSSIAHYHQVGAYRQAADAFLLYNKAGGRYIAALAARRRRERALYLSEVSDTPTPPPAPTNRDVQRRLVALGHDIVVDGILGPQTRIAIMAELALSTTKKTGG